MNAARERVGVTLDDAQYADLSRVIVGRPGPELQEARRVADEAATFGGRSALVDEARRAAREWVLQAFAQRGYSGTWAATDVAVSVARPADRAAVAEALADAVTASAVEDLVDDDTLDALRSRWQTLDMSSAIPEPGALNDLASGLMMRPGLGTSASLVVAILILLVGLIGLPLIGPTSAPIVALGLIVLISALWRPRSGD